MDILKDKKFRAATWFDNSRIVEGTLQLADFKTSEPASEKTNHNGYFMIIVDEIGDRHMIAPDTLEIIENPHFSTITQHLLDKGLTLSEMELFWRVSMQSAIEVFNGQDSGRVIIVGDGRVSGKTERLKLTNKILETASAIMHSQNYSTNESSSKYFNKPKDNFKKK